MDKGDVMNVIVSNLNKDEFSNLNVDIIKSISGEFTADEIVQTFSSFFFNKMFLDITAVQNYTDINNIKQLSVGMDVSKIILLLNSDPIVNGDGYISSLISMGIYNFARTEEELMYLYNNPNSYRDVAHLQKIANVQSFNVEKISSDVRIIGFRNFTGHAGATSLIYMLKQQLSKHYYTVAIEVNKRDFMFYSDKNMISCSERDVSNLLLKYKDANIILLDLNNMDSSLSRSLCGDIIYLMESSVLMINKLVMLDNNCFDKVLNEKVVLNRSILNEHDIEQLAKEANISFFSVLPPMNDRVDNSEILFPFLEKLKLYKRVS